MADSYSVKAILSATDKGFTSTLKGALSSVTGLANKIGSGMLMGAGMKAFDALTGGVKNLVGEISSSNAAWKTFDQNMNIAKKNGIKLEGNISGIKKELQDYAAKTVYSASDMAQTYAQLAAVGTKGTTELVKGFGGLAAAAENPSQAMKSLSQQCVQMDAKPKVAWQDFKLMLEQSPAGMAAVAKAMGMSTAELVSAVQDGKVKTQDFFDTIKKVGGSGTDFEKMATEFKTLEQAIDGTKDALGNKLGPALSVLEKKGIGIVSKFGEAVDGIDASGLADKVTGWIKKAQPYWESFKNAASTVGSVVSGVGKKLAPILKKISQTARRSFKGVLDSIAGIDVESVVGKISSAIDTAMQYFSAFKESFSGVGSAIGDALGALGDAFGGLFDSVDKASALETFKSIMEGVANAIKAVAGFIEEHADAIVKSLPYILGMVGAFKGFKIIQKIAPFVQSFTGAIGGLAKKGIGGIASKLFGVSDGQKAVGKSSASSSKQMLAAAKATMMMGVAVFLIAAGFALLAQSAIALSNA
ncbi:MAG: tape measure protein, partial [Erysipelotrichaceae bacterium]|nr:tape measure protein [Erysipelotrichaceae bacterium]